MRNEESGIRNGGKNPLRDFSIKEIRKDFYNHFSFLIPNS